MTNGRVWLGRAGADLDGASRDRFGWYRRPASAAQGLGYRERVGPSFPRVVSEDGPGVIRARFHLAGGLWSLADSLVARFFGVVW